MNQPDSACVANEDSDCVCAVRQINVIDDTDGYTIEGDTIVAATGVKRWDYCITDDEMRYEDVSPSGPIEPGIIDLGRR